MTRILLIHVVLANYIRSQFGTFIGEDLEPATGRSLSLFFKPLQNPVSPLGLPDEKIPGVLVTRDLRVIKATRNGELVLTRLRPSSSQRIPSAGITADNLNEIKIEHPQSVRFYKQTMPSTGLTRFFHRGKCITWKRFGLRLGSCSSPRSLLRFPDEQSPEASEDDDLLDILLEILTTPEQTSPWRMPIPMRNAQPGRYFHPSQPSLGMQGQPYAVVPSAQGNRVIPYAPTPEYQNGVYAHGGSFLYNRSSSTEMSAMVKALLLAKVLNEKNAKTTQRMILAMILLNEKSAPARNEGIPMASLLMALMMGRDYDNKIAKSDEEIRSMARREAILLTLEKSVDDQKMQHAIEKAIDDLKEHHAIDKDGTKKDKALEDRLMKEIKKSKGGGLFGAGGLAKMTPQGQALSAMGG